MTARRYTVVIADRSTGVIRRLTLSLRPTAAVAFVVLSLPVLVGLGARWSARAEIGQLRAGKEALEQENASYRAATGALTSQISSLQSAVSELGERTNVDPASLRAMNQLPAVVRSRAMGGTGTTAQPPLLSGSVISPEDTFGLLREILGALEGSLQLVRSGVERRQALAAATPSVWPAYGWLTGGFGMRKDPFTGGPDFHAGLDISADKGTPVYSTAAGVVDSTAYTGNYGNLAIVRHDFGLATRYGHLSRFAVKPGTKVQRGDLIGYVGSTGRATGPHVHYEVWANDRPLNPLQLLTRPAKR
jgi:murein DD-endopeptidase MepM/ murein hydrolase activator NlpD